MVRWHSVDKLSQAQEEWACWAAQELLEREQVTHRNAPNVQGACLAFPHDEAVIADLLGVLSEGTRVVMPPVAVPAAGRRLAARISRVLERHDRRAA